MKSVGEILKATIQFLEQKHHVRARRTSEELLGSVLQMKRLDLYMHFDRPVTEEELSRLRPLVKRGALLEPVEYILGRVAFYGVELHISPAVLIPRPETEILVDLVCQELKGESLEGKVAWDVCTGSGCIGLALKKTHPLLAVSLSDLSPEALTVARENGSANGIEVEYVESDLLSAFTGKKADYIVCNPPYVSAPVYTTLDPSVTHFEPKLALVGGEDGLEYYRRLKKELPEHLHPGAKIFFEMGHDQGAALLALFSEPWWKQKRVQRDWAGHERFFFLEFE